MTKKILGLVAVHAATLLALVLLAISSSGDVEVLFWCLSTGFAISQIVLLGIFAACTIAPMLFRMRWTYRLALVQWLCFSGPLLAVATERPMPWCLLASEFIVFVAAFISSWIFRLISRRGTLFDSPAPIAIKSKLQIIDLLILSTACAVLLGVSLRYSDGVGKEMLAGIEYFLMIAAAVCMGMPLALLLSIYAIGLILPSPRFAWYWAVGWLAATAVAYALLFYNPIENPASDLSRAVAIPIVVLVSIAGTTSTAMYLRHNGLRMRRFAEIIALAQDFSSGNPASASGSELRPASKLE